MHSGGKGANQAVAVARLSYPVQMIGMVGSDPPGKQLRTNLKSAGVDITGVEQVQGSSGVAVITLAAEGENCIVIIPGANAQVSPEYLNRHLKAIRGAGLVLAQLEIPLETVEYLAEVCSSGNIPLILDPAPARKLPSSLLERVRWFTPNETEAAFYLDGQPGKAFAATAHAMRVMGPRAVVLKLGARGVYVLGDETDEQIAAMAVNAVDTTAAGDAFNGAFAVGLLSGRTPAESAHFAAAAAAVSVTRAGAQPSMPTLAEVELFLKSTGLKSTV